MLLIKEQKNLLAPALLFQPPRRCALRRPLEHGHAFHMGGVGEHVHHASGAATVARLMHEQARVAGEGGGVAADVNYAARRLPAGKSRQGLG